MAKKFLWAGEACTVLEGALPISTMKAKDGRSKKISNSVVTYGWLPDAYILSIVRAPKSVGGFRVMAGCRFLTSSQALEHWTQRIDIAQYWQDRGSEARAEIILALLPKMKTRAKQLGWV